jgi:hypothetical protein
VAERLSLYDYLSFVVPGATILFVVVYGYDGWPRDEPGGSATLALVAAAFVVGYINAAVGNWIEPTFLGNRPGGRVDPLWGTLTGSSHYSEGERTALARVLSERYGDVPKELAYRLAYTELQQKGLDGPLQLMNQHLGFTRGAATATAIALAINLSLAATAGTHLPIAFWGPILAGSTAAFVMRYRRFWRRFGDHVLRGISTVHSATERATEREGAAAGVTSASNSRRLVSGGASTSDP